MTEKRFKRSNSYGWQKNAILELIHGLDELNRKLKEENEWLKKSIKRQQLSNVECSKYIGEVVKENEQLKSTNMEMEDYLGRLEERIKELKKENQELLLIIQNQKLRDEMRKNDGL